MTDLLREAEEEIRRETIEGTAKKAAPFFIGAIILALVAGGAFQLWRNNQDKAREQASLDYYAAMEKLKSGDLDGGIKALDDLSKHAPKGFATLAAIQKADVIQEKGDQANALAAFDAAANMASDPDLKAMAQMRAAYIAADLETREKLNARLDPIIKANNALTPLARELKAAAAWNAKDYKAAKDEYSLLQIDPNAPEGVRQRAGQASAIIDAQAEIAPDLMEIPTQNGQQEAANAPVTEGAQQGAPAVPKGVEIGPDGKRIVRLPPGVKLPPGTKIPPDVRVIETPLPPEQAAKMQAQQNAAKADLQKQIEEQRKKAMEQEKAVTKAQQDKVDEIANAASGAKQ